MKRISILFLSLCAAFFFSAAAADIKPGIDYFKAGQYEPAREVLLSLTGDSQNGAEACFYLGEVCFAEGKSDSAFWYYQRGNALNPDNPDNRIGLGKIRLQQGDRKGAVDLFEAVLSGKEKRNPDLWVAVARACFSVGGEAECRPYLEKAAKLDSEAASVSILNGDIAAAARRLGDASAAYETAIRNHPDCAEAYYKYAQIYTGVNPRLSIRMLQQLLTVDPASLTARRKLAELYFADGKMGDAARLYAEVVASEHPLAADVSRYAAILFFNGEYERSRSLVEEALRKHPSDMALNRLCVYTNYELKNREAAFQAAERLMTADGDVCIALDYLYYGKLLRDDKRFDEALVQFGKALALDSSRIDLYKEMALTHESLNRYDDALHCYRAYFEQIGEKAVANDYLLAGRCCYGAGNARLAVGDTVAGRKELTEADSLFHIVSTRVPENFNGYLWQARARASLDPETERGDAKPCYEKALELLVRENGDSRRVIECCSYLGYFYYLKNDYPRSRGYWEQILAVDPQNETARKALDGMR